MRIFIITLLFLLNCEGGDLIIISKHAVIGNGCNGVERNFVLTIKDQYSLVPAEHEGEIKIGTSGYEYQYKGYSKTYNEYKNDYLIIFGGQMGFDWAKLKITCPITGKILFDSGEVAFQKAICFQDKTQLFFMEGHSQLKPGDSCCPENLNCSFK